MPVVETIKSITKQTKKSNFYLYYPKLNLGWILANIYIHLCISPSGWIGTLSDYREAQISSLLPSSVLSFSLAWSPILHASLLRKTVISYLMKYLSRFQYIQKLYQRLGILHWLWSLCSCGMCVILEEDIQQTNKYMIWKWLGSQIKVKLVFYYHLGFWHQATI